MGDDLEPDGGVEREEVFEDLVEDGDDREGAASRALDLGGDHATADQVTGQMNGSLVHGEAGHDLGHQPIVPGDAEAHPEGGDCAGDARGGHGKESGPSLQLLTGQLEEAEEPLAPSREEMLEAIPLHVVLASDIDLDAEDPARLESGRRACVAERRAGGRCTAPPATHSLLCTAHSGLLDASAGGKAKARKLRERAESVEERARLARLGPRAVIAETLAAQATKLQRTVTVLLDAAAEGDLQAAKLVAPYINQAHGMPAQRVDTYESSHDLDDLSSLSTEELLRRQAELRLREAKTA